MMPKARPMASILIPLQTPPGPFPVDPSQPFLVPTWSFLGPNTGLYKPVKYGVATREPPMLQYCDFHGEVYINQR